MQCNLFNLEGRTAVITGGSKGLGKAMARGLAECGADIMINSRHEDDLKSAVAEIGDGLDVRVEYCVTDMGDRGSVDAFVEHTLATMGKVDILINNAGVNVPQPIDECEDEVWDRVVEINLTAIMRLTRAFVPGMMERKWGRVIHISSVLGVGSKPGRNNYSATKAALIGLAKASALDLGLHGVTVNCIGPGPFLTDMPLNLLNAEQQQEFSDITALNRWGQPRELAGPAILLSSEAGSYITGELLLVDGGAFARAL